MKLVKPPPKGTKIKMDLSNTEKNRQIDLRAKRLNFNVNEECFESYVKYDTLIGISGRFFALKSSRQCIQAVFYIENNGIREVVQFTAQDSFFVGGERTFVINNDIY